MAALDAKNAKINFYQEIDAIDINLPKKLNFYIDLKLIFPNFENYCLEFFNFASKNLLIVSDSKFVESGAANNGKLGKKRIKSETNTSPTPSIATTVYADTEAVTDLAIGVIQIVKILKSETGAETADFKMQPEDVSVLKILKNDYGTGFSGICSDALGNFVVVNKSPQRELKQFWLPVWDGATRESLVSSGDEKNSGKRPESENLSSHKNYLEISYSSEDIKPVSETDNLFINHRKLSKKTKFHGMSFDFLSGEICLADNKKKGGRCLILEPVLES